MDALREIVGRGLEHGRIGGARSATLRSIVATVEQAWARAAAPRIARPLLLPD